MKRILAFLLVVVMLFSCIPAISFAVGGDLSTKLIAEYNFDEQTTNDSVGGHDAVFYNNASVTAAEYTDGISGKALQLSTKGTNEKYWLSVPYDAFGTDKDSFTISLWYKSTGHNTAGENSELFSLYNSHEEKFLFCGAQFDGNPNAFTMKWDSTYGYANIIGGYKEHEWVHLVFAVDGGSGQSKITAYINGTPVEVDQGGEWANGLMSQLGIDTFTIGGKNPYKGGDTPNCLFYGMVDEVQIYSGALSAEEAATLYNAIMNPPVERGDLLAEYHFDDNTTNDAVGNHNATLFNDSVATEAVYTDGIAGGKALQLSTPGADEKYWLSVPYSAFKGSTDAFTISMWYKSSGHNTTGENSELFSLYNSKEEKFLFYGAQFDGNPNAFAMKWDSTYGYANVIGGYKENEWVHLVLAVDAVDGESKISAYINGITVEVDQGGEWANSLMSHLGIDTFTIGGKNPYKGGDSPSCLFYGAVDEIKLYAGALTEEEAAAIYTSDTACNHSYEENIIKEATIYETGEATYACIHCGESYHADLPAVPVRILAIGNSYSVDSTTYLWDIGNAAGIKNLIVGNAEIGGSSLDDHWANMENGENQYGYHKFTVDGVLNSQASFLGALQDEQWDYIVLQQNSSMSGEPSTYGHLEDILAFVDAKKTNHDAKILWNMTWAYPQNSTDARFEVYNKDQMTMYNAIVQTTQEIIVPNECIDGVIPTGTAIQNLRSSYLGDVLCRDNVHLSYDHGRYTAAMLWFAYITGGDVTAVDWLPETYSYISNDLPAIREAVSEALAFPFEVSTCESKREGGDLVVRDPIAEYNFNNETTNDTVGKNHAAFYNNDAVADPSYVDGISGKALQLSTKGTDEKFWLSIPYTAFGEYQDSFTLSIWYNTSAYNESGEDSELFSFYNSKEEKFLFYSPASTAFQDKGFTMKWDGDYGYANVITPNAQNEWKHLVYVVKAEENQTKIAAYVNGSAVEVDQGGDWTDSLMSLMGVDTFTIGGKNPYKGGIVPNCLFYGAVDEIRIYDGELNPMEARAVYQQGFEEPEDIGPGETELPEMPEGLLANYDFNDATLNDSVNGNNAALYNNISWATPKFAEGIRGNALRLSTKGTGERMWLSIPYSVFGENQNDFTISIWYNATGYNRSGEDSELFSLYNSRRERFLFYSPASVNFQDKGFSMQWDGAHAGYANVVTPYKKNEWVHLVFAVTPDGNTSRITAYVNGVEVEVDQGDDWVDSLMSQLGINTFTIGGKNPYKGGEDPECLFYGLVDEIQLYAGKLTAEDAQAIYLNTIHRPVETYGKLDTRSYGIGRSVNDVDPIEPEGLVASYDFNNETTRDSVGKNHALFYDGAGVTKATYVDGIRGKALQMSTKMTGEKYWLSIPYEVFGENPDTFSLSIWYNASNYNTLGEDSELFSFYNTKGERFMFYSPASTAFQDKAFTMQWDGTNAGYANVITPYDPGKWVHLVFAVEAQGNQSVITAFVNGEAVEVDQGGEWEDSLMSLLGIDRFTIGGKNPYKGGQSPACLFYGMVDEIQIYDHALTEANAKAIYLAVLNDPNPEVIPYEGQDEDISLEIDLDDLPPVVRPDKNTEPEPSEPIDSNENTMGWLAIVSGVVAILAIAVIVIIIIAIAKKKSRNIQDEEEL